MRKVRRGDTVLVLTGKDRGKQGRVRRVLPEENRVIIEGVNIVKRHLKARPGVAQTGIIEKEAPISVANVKLMCPKCGKPARMGFKLPEGGKKVRVCKRCHQELE